jgi:hypothetical protein
VTHKLHKHVTSVGVTKGGGVYASTEGFFEVENVTQVNMFNHEIFVLIRCRVKVGNSVKVSLDMFSGQIKNHEPVECDT